MITRTQLNQIYYLNKEYVMWKRKLDELKHKRDSSKSLSDIDPTGIHSGHITDAVGVLAADIVDIEDIMTGILANIQYERKQILKHIATVEDSQLRQIIQYRCVDLMSWVQVGHAIGMPGDTARMIFTRAYPK